jgi:guanine deaminase
MSPVDIETEEDQKLNDESAIDIDSDEDKKQFLHEATKLAIESVEKGWGGPFGAVIVRNGKIIGRGQNRVLLTGIPIYHAEVTAIIDACSRINPKALLGSDYYEGNLKMIPRPPGSPDPVPELRTLRQWCALSNVYECHLLGADRSSLFWDPPRGHRQNRL